MVVHTPWKRIMSNRYNRRIYKTPYDALPVRAVRLSTPGNLALWMGQVDYLKSASSRIRLGN